MSRLFEQEKNRTAVALYYDGVDAPTVSASGSGLLGEKIIEIAGENGVPVHQNPGLAAALANVPLGEEIPRELYLAVAEVLAFIYFLDESGTGNTTP